MESKFVEYDGERHTVKEWAAIFGLDEERLLENLEATGYSMERALNYSGKKRERLIEFRGKVQNLSQWAQELGLPYFCLRSRLNVMKWTVEKAFTTPYGGGSQNGQ